MAGSMNDNNADQSDSTEPELVNTDDLKPEGYDGTCLRPLGLCDLGGCCEICWYSSTSERGSEGSDAADNS